MFVFTFSDILVLCLLALIFIMFITGIFNHFLFKPLKTFVVGYFRGIYIIQEKSFVSNINEISIYYKLKHKDKWHAYINYINRFVACRYKERLISEYKELKKQGLTNEEIYQRLDSK